MKEHRMPQPWVVICLVFLSIVFFLVLMLQTMPKDAGRPLPQSSFTENSATTPPPPFSSSSSPKGLALNGDTADKSKILALVQECMKHHFYSSPDIHSLDLSLGKNRVSGIKIAKTFFVYESSLSLSSRNEFILKIIIDPPEISIHLADNPDYSKFYPLLNPFFHVLELEYVWTFSNQTPDPIWKLKSLTAIPVEWESNRYNKLYKDTKNSPLYEENIVEPIQWSPTEIQTFLKQTGLFDSINVVFPEEISVVELKGKLI